MSGYILGIDQSTQGTKALLFNEQGAIVQRCDAPHRQIVNDRGWVEHDPEEIVTNIREIVAELIRRSGIDAAQIGALGISNQRETAVVWERANGRPVCNAIVWQCARAEEICLRLEKGGFANMVKEHTGINLSPYFTAAKIAWVLENVAGARELSDKAALCCGTMDSFLIHRLTGGASFRTDYSNASRTQLFNIHTLSWDADICNLFQIDPGCLAEVVDSDSLFGETDVFGVLPRKIPIHAALGDSHAALYGQGCHDRGMAKCTYGTGSSVMMNIGEKPVVGGRVVTSLAWGIGGKVDYVLEGNINYTGAVITWLKEDLGLIGSSGECAALAETAKQDDTTVLVPAFSGLGAPYWKSDAKAMLFGMTRRTGKNEIVRAAEECIAYQIADVLAAMEEDAGLKVRQLRVDGGPTRDRFLMQFQSDMIQKDVVVPDAEELSAIGAAYLAGIASGLFRPDALFTARSTKTYSPSMPEGRRKAKYDGWRHAVGLLVRD